MIRSLWIKIFSIVLLLVLPLVMAQYLMQKESIEIAFNIAEKNNPVDLLDSHMNVLKLLSKYEPEKAGEYKREFEKTFESTNVARDLKIIRVRLIDDILIQTLRNTLIVLLISLVVTYWIARSIVALLRTLISENQVQSLRLERLGALESWQKVARMIVHELRTPLTPIQLVATDIESKYQDLKSDAFQKYLANGTELIRSQIYVIERLIDGLTRFAKLPDTQKKKLSISQFFRQFAETYAHYGDGRIQIEVQSKVRIDEISFDPALMSLLFFNLLKNAVEANPNEHIQVRVKVEQSGEFTYVSFANTGKHIPNELAEEIFKPHVSTRAGSSSTNFGVGLTIAKKIAYDHNGDLSLIKNQSPTGVEFKLEIPNS